MSVIIFGIIFYIIYDMYLEMSLMPPDLLKPSISSYPFPKPPLPIPIRIRRNPLRSPLFEFISFILPFPLSLPIRSNTLSFFPVTAYRFGGTRKGLSVGAYGIGFNPGRITIYAPITTAIKHTPFVILIYPYTFYPTISFTYIFLYPL